MGKAQSVSVRLHVYPDRPIGLIWRSGVRTGEVSSGKRDRREAERAAGRLEEQLLAGVIPTTQQGIAITWAEFRARYEREWLESMSYGSRQGWAVAANHFEAICQPKLLADVNKSMLSRFLGGLESRKISPHSVRSYYRALRAGLGWAESIDLVSHVPKIRHRKTGKQSAVLRTRTITAEEFERLVAAIPSVRVRKFRDVTETTRQLQVFVKGLWYSGLRIDELNRLRWEKTAPLHVDLDGKLPLIVILGAQKNRSDCYLPAPAEFWQLLGRPQRMGPVFPVRSHRGSRFEEYLETRTLGRLISEAGRKAGVVVNPRTGKCATAHDLRAAYLTRVAAVTTMSQAQALARHSDPKTTSQFYVRHRAEELAAAVGWK